MPDALRLSSESTQGPAASASRGQFGWRLAAVLGGAFLLRLPGLASRPMWYDEAIAALLSGTGLEGLLRATLTTESGVAANVHPPLYFVLLGVWGRVFGTGPAAARSLSVLFGLGVVFLGMVLARRLLGPRAAIIAGIGLALSPFQVHYAQETRMYALLAFLLLASTLVFLGALERGGWRNWLAFSLLAAAAQYTHNLAFAYLLPLSLLPLFRRQWRRAVQTAAAGVTAIILYSPWLIHLPSQLARVESAYWIQPPGVEDLVRTLMVFNAGLPVPEWSLPAVLACSLLTFALGIWSTVRAIRAGEPTAAGGRVLLYLALAPVGVVLLVSLWTPVYLDRAMLASGAAFILWLAWALTQGGLIRVGAGTGLAAALVGMLIGLVGFFRYEGFPYAPYGEIDEHLRRHLASGELLLHSNKISAIPAAYAGRDLDHRYLPDPPGSGSDTLAPSTQQVLGLVAETDIVSAVGGAHGVWFVQFPREVAEYQDLGYAEHPALAWLESNFRADAMTMFGELAVYHFVR